MAQKLVGLLALQGAFREHRQMLETLGASTRELRQRKDIDGIDALILPGGESTTIGKLLVDLEMLEPLQNMLKQGLPCFGTCAGLITLADHIEGREQPRLGGIDMTVRRNAFGRQVDSFETELDIAALGNKPFPAVFIRAPLITDTGVDVECLATVRQNGVVHPVAVRQKNLLATSFHPELTNDSRFHEYFLNM